MQSYYFFSKLGGCLEIIFLKFNSLLQKGLFSLVFAKIAINSQTNLKSKEYEKKCFISILLYGFVGWMSTG
jgi:hypothetical protein